MSQIEGFREETRIWLEKNCPTGAKGIGQVPTGSTKIKIEDPDVTLWLDRMIEKGWTAPTWPKEFGGADLSTEEYVVLIEEMRRLDARPALGGMGTSMIGPTLLEYGTDEQKQEHLPKIAKAEVAWCQGYSEPGSGSDLASLNTRAVDSGDHYLINGQKIWTSGAQWADWMFCLVRTDPEVPKHNGISFVLLSMDQPGVTVKPIRLISGNSPFCETFFDDAVAYKANLVGELNKGWTVGKRLLQHERSGMASLVGAQSRDPGATLQEVAQSYLGTDREGKVADAALRSRAINHEINDAAFALTRKRTVQEAEDGNTPGPATSIFKMYGTELEQDKSSLMCEIRGTQGIGWEGSSFDSDEIEWTRSWLSNRAASIYSGTNEIQRNIIAKRVLGLPD